MNFLEVGVQQRCITDTLSVVKQNILVDKVSQIYIVVIYLFMYIFYSNTLSVTLFQHKLIISYPSSLRYVQMYADDMLIYAQSRTEAEKVAD